jgi:UDP-N-acetylenolpyruvoylglucosamine reductase
LKIFRRGEFLAKVVEHKKLLAIVGSHGKTSVCSRISQILASTGMAFDYLVGGFFKDGNIDPAQYNFDAEWVIAEVDESDCTINNFSPEVTVALNYDDDHVVNYSGDSELKAAFSGLFARTKSKVYVTSDDAVFGAMVSQAPEKFSIFEELPSDDFVLRNGKIADAVARDLFGVEMESNRNFSEIKRRNDFMCRIGNFTFVHDYAHHPTEIEAVLKYARTHYPDHELTVVFQPHRVSRTRQYFKEFANILNKFDNIVLVEVYRAFEEKLNGISSKLIYDNIANGRKLFVENIENFAAALEKYCYALPQDRKHLVLFACAGDLLKYAESFVGGRRMDVAFERIGGDICFKNVPLKAKTTFGCNATACLFATPKNSDELLRTIEVCRELNLEYFPLGSGANVVFQDGVYNKLVVKLTGEYWERAEFLSEDRLRVYAGAKLSIISGISRRKGFNCLTFLECIPGTIGGAVTMNAGAHGHSIAEFISEVCLLDGSGGDVRLLSVEECGFRYRSSEIRPKSVILHVDLKLTNLPDACDNYRDVRMATQPGGRTFGSIFKNPVGDHAGRLIDACGLKGYGSGAAVISDRHANFLVNASDASSSDVERVIDRARYEVFNRFGIFLETEVLLLRK